MATSLENDDERTALQHALDWKRSATILGVVCFGVAIATFWAAQAGYGIIWARISYVATFVAAMSGIAAFLCGFRAFQLSRDGKGR